MTTTRTRRFKIHQDILIQLVWYVHAQTNSSTTYMYVPALLASVPSLPVQAVQDFLDREGVDRNEKRAIMIIQTFILYTHEIMLIPDVDTNPG